MHDEDIYQDPRVFRPERFLTSDGKSLDSSVLDPSSVMFGYGRRIWYVIYSFSGFQNFVDIVFMVPCSPGRFLGLDLLWLTIGSILATYNIQHALDHQGNVIEPPGTYVVGISRNNPDPFECTLTPRSQATEDIVNIL